MLTNHLHGKRADLPLRRVAFMGPTGKNPGPGPFPGPPFFPPKAGGSNADPQRHCQPPTGRTRNAAGPACSNQGERTIFFFFLWRDPEPADRRRGVAT